MGFSDRQHLLELSTHEFGHSFVNHVVGQMPAELLKSTEKLYPPIQNRMTEQGYPTWLVCLYKHFVRAGEILITQNLGHAEAARRLREHSITNRQFIYLPTILTQLENYRQTQSTSYPQAVEKALQQLQALAAKQ
ncbi:DUF4932 domain-containing protein [Larkinella sp. VNQ87]|uniref:DUF4932 domain-containing protein n=1 Tax=Larkinella sp. VNQ87 TaxID=3400921 RepID=UPI003BFB9D72